ncbi:unnamed protein product [Ectocarpus sp. CCAP 1310/34]|nr:unnamed protein product [Ectocarpus sp. CCAP 1310/34]
MPAGGNGAAGTAPLSAAASAFVPSTAAAAAISTASSTPSTRPRRGHPEDDNDTSNSGRGGRGAKANNDYRRKSGRRNIGGDGATAPPHTAGEDTQAELQQGSNSNSSKRGGSKRGGWNGSKGRGGGGGRGRGDRGNAAPNRNPKSSSRGAGRGGGGGSRAVDQEEEGGRPLCIVCANEMEYFAVGECNHPGRCSTCAMRSRVLLKDRSCPECKTVQDRLVVAELPASRDAPRFETFNLWGDFAGPDSVFDDESGMVFYACRGHYDDLLRMRDLYCPVTGCKGAAAGGREGGQGCGVGGHELFPNIGVCVFSASYMRSICWSTLTTSTGALMEHLKDFHQRFLCELCLEGRPLFLSEQEVFTASGLRKHEARVEGGHPLCRFCNKRFFDNTALYDHMTGTHINCHLCPEENQHRQARYFRGEPQLRDHLRTSHFLCDRGACRQRGVVSAFNTPLEFQAHLLEDHGITDRRAASAGGVGFNVRRAARDGTGLHTSYNSVADATTPTGESLAAPDPELDLAGGVMVPVPSTRGRESTVPAPGTTPTGRTRNLPSGGGSAAADPLQEAFPSLPAAPPRSSGGGGGGGGGGAGGGARQERHALSLVGKNIRPDHQRGGGGRAGGGAPTGSSVSSRGGVGGGGGGHGSEEKEKEKRQLLRNKRLADALGIRAALGAGAAIGGAKVGTTASGAAVAMGIGDGLDAIREHLTRTNYSTYLVSWARANRTELGKLERRLAELVSDPKGTSCQLKPMPSLDRKAAHELAAHYGLVTQSYDLEPKRYVSVIKQKGCRLPTRLLSSAAQDPSYTGTDEVPAAEGGGAAPALERTTTNPNPRATSLLGPASTPSGGKGSDHPPPGVTPSLGGGGGPRTSTVTSISSADPLAVDPVAAAEAAAAAANNAKADGKKAFFQRSKRRGVPPPSSSARPATATPAPAAKAATILADPFRQDRDEKEDAAAAEELKGRETSNDSVPGNPKKSGSASGSGSLPEAVKSAAAGTPSGHGGRNRGNGAGPGGAAAVGPDNPECLLVFHSVQAGLGGGDAVLASVRTLVPARTVVGVRPATAKEVSAAGVQGHRGGGGSGGSTLIMEFSSALNARRAWEKVEKEAEQLVAAARVTRTDHHAPFRAKLYPSAPPADDGGVGGCGSLVDVVRDNWDDSSEEEDEEPVGVARDGARDEGGDDETERKEEPRLQDSHEDEDRAQEHEGKEEKLAPRETGDDDSTASPAPGASAAAATAAVPTAVAPAAAAAPSSTGTGKRHSKWGNSAIKGRLSRPSDGRATTVEQEAAARQERLEKLSAAYGGGPAREPAEAGPGQESRARRRG